MAAGRASEWVCIAKVATAHGVRGALKIRCFTERPEDVVAYGPVYDRTGNRLFELKIVSHNPGGVIAKVAGIDDRNAAEALRGCELYVPRANLPEPDADEFYYGDLEGLDVVAPDGGRIGVVRGVGNYGAGDLIEIRTDDGSDLILPFDRASIPDIDLDQGVVTVVVPAVATTAEALAEETAP